MAAPNFNTASVGQLVQVPGIGRVLAERIVDHRDRYGPFLTFANLEEVKGIGRTKQEAIQRQFSITGNRPTYNVSDDHSDYSAYDKIVGRQFPNTYFTYYESQANFAPGAETRKYANDTITYTSPTASSSRIPHTKFDLNLATPEQLAELPKISMELAERIVTNRSIRGCFESYDDLRAIRNIGVKTIEMLQNYSYIKSIKQEYEPRDKCWDQSYDYNFDKVLEPSRLYCPRQESQRQTLHQQSVATLTKSVPTTSASSVSNHSKFDLNLATSEELAELPRVSLALAESIVAARKKLGKFHSYEDLIVVRGVDERTTEIIQTHTYIKTVKAELQPKTHSSKYDKEYSAKVETVLAAYNTASSRSFYTPQLGLNTVPNKIKAKTFETAALTPSSKFDLNTVTPEQLAELPRISLELAKRIVENRNENGNFESYDDLREIRNVGEKTIEIIKTHSYIEIRRQKTKETTKNFPKSNANSSMFNPGLLDLNLATPEQLAEIPKISLTLAERIVDNRDEDGNFESFDDLRMIQSVGEKTIEIIKNYCYIKTSHEEDESSEENEYTDEESSGSEHVDFFEDIMVDQVCKYISKTKFKQLDIDFRKLFLLHVNIVSLKKNVQRIEDLIHPLHHKPDVMCVSESRNPQFVEDVDISGYFFRQTKSKTQAGGVAIYVDCGFRSKERKDLLFSIPDCENIWVEITGKRKSYVIGSVYRHPRRPHLNAFMKKLETVMEKLNLEKKIFYIIGDININMLQETSQHVKKYAEMLWNLGVKLLVNKPTRVTKTRSSNTLLDHIYTNDSVSRDLETGIIETHDISDHYPVYCIV